MKPRAPDTILTVAISFLLLWSLVLPLMFFGAADAALNNDNLVYCPLQKKWVAPASSPPVEAKVDVFDQICAAPGVKTNIFQNVFARLSAFQTIADARAAEDLIFDYLRHGDAVVKAFRGAPLPSPAQSAGLYAAEKALNNTNQPLFKLPLAAVCSQLRARPPTGKPLSVFSYNNPDCNLFDGNLSPNLLPRPPPVFS